MQKRVAIFNPDHDLALANDNENYLPPASILRMAGDLSYLPAWYLPPGGKVLCPAAPPEQWIDGIRELLDTTGLFIERKEAGSPSFIPEPWGWNKSVVKQLREMGFATENLPAASCLEKIKQFSHRQTASRLLPLLRSDSYFCGSSSRFTTLEEVTAFVRSHPEAVLKAPYSGSGKGLCWCEGVFTPPMANWCRRVLKKQGEIIGEPVYDKVEDFAMLFHCDGVGKARFAGYSCFVTDNKGLYKGNLLLPDSTIEERIGGYVGTGRLVRLRKEMARLLTTVLGNEYHGYLGVDMMVCRFADPPEFRLHPCVEINLRMTMGVVSRLLYDRYIDRNRSGEFFVDHFPDPRELAERHRKARVAYPLLTAGGRIVQGYLCLTPVREDTRYRAWMVVR